MPQTRTSCPRCRQPVAVDVEQLFDLNVDPKAKQRFLSGASNMVHCTNCGYEGMLPVPIVFHDPDKDLLLTYFPSELGLPVNEQERLIGPLITQVMNKLAMEKRKAYLFRPQTMLTFQLMLEKVLEADGITREMLQAQQARLNLLQRLLSTAPANRSEVIKQEEALIDESFLIILNRLSEASLAQGDQQSAQVLAGLQQDILKNTKIGQNIQSQALEMDEAVKTLKAASEKGLTRDLLLDLFIEAPSETRLTTLVSLTRQGMDYPFFQILANRIEQAQDDKKKKLSELRDKLLLLVEEVDKTIKEERDNAHQLLEEILHSDSISTAVQENAQAINEIFLETLKMDLESASNQGDLARIAKLQELVKIIQALSAPPPEIALAQELVGAQSEAERLKILEDNAGMITAEFVQMLGNLVGQSESKEQEPAMVEALKAAYRSALKFSMKAQIKK
jgi:hypothetical protein